MRDISKGFHALLHRIDDIAAEECMKTKPSTFQHRVLDILQKIRVATHSPTHKAIAAAKLGAIYLTLKEPHNADPVLEEAGHFFFQELMTFTEDITFFDMPNGQVKTQQAVLTLLDNMPQVDIKNEHEEFVGYVVELLIQMGVLWSKRSRPMRAICYLTAGLKLIDRYEHKKWDGFVAAQTMVCFYLAQVYEQLGMAEESAKFCLLTLEMQLLQCVRDDKNEEMLKLVGADEWVRNALKLVEFYLNADNLIDAATCLQGSEYMLLQRRIGGGEEVEYEQSLLTANIYTMWGRVHETTLRLAGMRKEGLYPKNADPKLRHACSMETTLAKLSYTRQSELLEGQSTPGLGMEFVPPHCLETFDQARDVFKMGVFACSRARRVFAFDTFATQYVHLLQQESALYRQLLPFEDVRGRRVAIQRRRLALLTPLLEDALIKRSYAGLLQEIYFECAEINSDVFELKQDKDAGEKSMTYAINAIQCYQEFLLLCYSVTEPDGASCDDHVRASVLRGGKGVQLPPGKALCLREFRAMLMGYFGLANACGKILFLSDAAKIVGFWCQSLAYYEAVTELARKYASICDAADGIELKRSLKSELNICDEMTRLLPEKIDQLVYNGKAF
uniref:KIF-binding protein n=1 Tax=Peronospora matthiolae TaxID=2874970 RepID=A0AAV1T9T9_9STRA